MNSLRTVALSFALVLGANTAIAQQSLPGESQIPSRSAPDPLPDENELPGGSNQATESQTAGILPVESELPDTMKPSIDPAEPKNDPQTDTDDLQPWLRLNVGGPSAELLTVEFSSDSKKLFAGGRDKSLHAWQMVTDARTGDSRWVYEKAVLWQVQRARLGQIHAVAACDKALVFGGIGASALTGELPMFDSKTLRFRRTLFDVKSGPRAIIRSISCPDSGDFVAAIDGEGRVVVWQDAEWKMKLLRDGDRGALDVDDDLADLLLDWRLRGCSIASAENGNVIFPEFSNRDQYGYPNWELVSLNVFNEGRAKLTSQEKFVGTVTAISISADGQRIAASDFHPRGSVFLWDVSSNAGAKAKIEAVGGTVRSLQLSRDGKLLAISTFLADASGSIVKIMGWEKDQLVEIASWPENDLVFDIGISPDQTQVAYTIGNSVIVRSLASLDALPQRLTGTIMRPNRVDFVSNKTDDPEETQYDYNINIALAESVSSNPEQWLFDTQHLRLDKANQNNFRKTRQRTTPAGWMIKEELDDNSLNKTYSVEIDGESFGRLDIDSLFDGEIVCRDWIVDPKKPRLPIGLVVGTTGRNQIYVFRFDPEKGCVLVRQYRGHSATVVSVRCSKDLRYLVSCSRDQTIRFWKLDKAIAASPPNDPSIDRWGASFETRDGKIFVKEAVADGPFYGRGFREGDLIFRIGVGDSSDQAGEGVKFFDEAVEMLTQLESGDHRKLFRFYSARLGNERPLVFLNAAWQPLASLVITPDREWAYWTPYGYYDASFNGHVKFGWQVNKGLENEPDFFRAAEMQEQFEKPRLMEKLLEAGSVEQALTDNNQSTPRNLQARLKSAERLRPIVKIQFPLAGQTVHNYETAFRAEVELPNGVRLARISAFANGIPAAQLELSETETVGSSRRLGYAGRLAIPGDQRIRIQLLAASDDGIGAMDQLDVNHTFASSDRKPRLFLLAAGIDNYADNRIPRLDFAVNNVHSLHDTLANGVADAYETQTIVLTNPGASRSLWQVATESIRQQLKNAHPDDLMVIFLSGHGYRDPDSSRYFYLTSTTRFDDLMSRQYFDCISFADFASFAKIPCRKLVILDSCYSGQVESLRQSDLKTVVRTLEKDMVFLVTASEGTQEAFESPEQKLSFFTASMLTALQGAGDSPAHGGNKDGRVSLDEVVRYVQTRVPVETGRLGYEQYPTASPSDLLDFIEMPLTVTGSHSADSLKQDGKRNR